MLESIIGRTVEQSMTEVQHEEEIVRARSHPDYSVDYNYNYHDTCCRKIKQEHMNSVAALALIADSDC